jgi:hypothetical protein
MPCDCSGLNGAGRALDIGGGLGQIDPVSVGLVFADAKHMWDDLIAALGIGAGRREADVIVPLQNKVVATVIAPVVDYLTAIREGRVQGDCNTLKTDKIQLESGEKQWLNFLHTTQWQDGRAAVQAEATLAPYFTNAKAELITDINEACTGSGIADSIGDTIGNILTTPEGGINWPVVGIGAGIAFMLLRKK